MILSSEKTITNNMARMSHTGQPEVSRSHACQHTLELSRTSAFPATCLRVAETSPYTTVQCTDFTLKNWTSDIMYARNLTAYLVEKSPFLIVTLLQCVSSRHTCCCSIPL